MKRTRNCLRNNLYFLGKVVQIAPLYLFLSAALRVMMGVRTSYMNVYFLAYVISCVEEGKPLIHVLLFIAVSFGAVSITYGLQAAFENLYQPVSLERIQQELQHTIFQKARMTDLEVYDSEEYYTSVILANSESSNRVLAVLENLLNLMETVVTIAMIVGYSLTMDWIVPVVAILSFTISFLMNQYIARLRVEYDNDLQQVNKETSMLHRILYLPDFAKDIRLTGIRDGMLRLYRKANKVKDALIRRKGKKIGFVAALEIIFSGAVCIDFLVPLYLVCRILIQKTLVASQFVAIVNGCNQLQLKLEDLAKEIGVFYQNGEFIQRYRRVEFRPNKIENSVGLEEESSPPAFRELALHNVSFQYPSGGFALKDINLTIHKGEKIAIVGTNGSGKTTLIKLLLRFYDCSNGEMLYNGTSVTELPINQYRHAFSTLFQDFGIYALTVAQNVAMDQQVDEERARDALSQVGMEDALPYLQTVLTRELEDNGLSFSGGQLQRLALARVLYENHEILVMDEPTSAMDMVFEKEFYDRILCQLPDKTILFVSHRLTSAVICDRILYMENGRITEIGSHRELMEENEGYARLFQAQTSALGESMKLGG